MARKSRKHKNIVEISQIENIVDLTNRVPTALYARLSEENNGYGTEDSINTQIKLIENFIHTQSDLVLADRFVDNGFTGTNFERPEFVRMMEKVKTGEIRCIVVKDLSRFGRDYLETGYYIETIFPLLGVRLIAVTDHFDTARQSDKDSLLIPIKNMVNAMFAKDVSRKQVAAGNFKRQMGIPNYKVSPFGYQYNEETQRLELDPELAIYVRMIFSWTLIGVKRSVIAERFNLMGVPTPLEIVQKQGLMEERQSNVWNAHTIRDILSNPVYEGTVVLGKSKQSLYQGIKPKKIKREDWLYFPNMHEGIVTRDEYEKIENIINENKQKKKKEHELNEENRNGIQDCFKGMIFCGDCGTPMSFERGTHKHIGGKAVFACYRCKTNRKKSGCKNHRVMQNFLKIVVVDQIKFLIQSMCDKRKILKKIQRDEVRSNQLRILRREITMKQGKARELDNKKAMLYRDMAEGLIDEEDYQLLKERTIIEIQNNNDEIAVAEQKILEIEKAMDQYIRLTNKWESYLDEVEFDEELVHEIIKTIYVYSDNRIKIIFNCEDIIQNKIVEENMPKEEVLVG